MTDSLPLDVLVIDDERNIRGTLSLCLNRLGCRVSAAATPDAARAALASRPFDLAFLDLRLGDANGLDLLPELIAGRPQLAVVIVSAQTAIHVAVEAMRRGAVDYLAKPFTPAQVREVIREATARAHPASALAIGAALGPAGADFTLESRSLVMRRALDMIPPVAAASAAVLLRGENGTGKTLFARLIHQHSARREQPFVVVNCPTLSEPLLASELFGHSRGAFTDAVRDKPGRVETADGGTLFLDEIGEITPAVQAKLLRFLQDHQFERVGDTVTRTADVRIIAATNRDLEADVRNGRFREDLLYRLNVVEIALPPLRERREDVLPLAERFLAAFAREAGRPAPVLSPAAAALLQRHPWPGNVRELRNAIERALILWPDPVIAPAAFAERVANYSASAPQLGSDCTVDAIEREHIQQVVARTPRLEDAARTLGIDTSTLWRKRRR